jgi:hypothetical protein
VKIGPLEVSPLMVGEVSHSATIAEAFDAGVNCFVVSADLHWPAFEHTRRGLAELLRRRGLRDRLVVVGVSWATQPEHAFGAFREILDAVPGLGRLDLLALGGLTGSDALPKVAALTAMRKEAAYGCQAIAASFHVANPAAFLLENDLIDLGLLRLNATDDAANAVLQGVRVKTKGSVAFGFDALGGFQPPERLDELGVDPLNWRPSPLDHYRFALSQRGVQGLLLSYLGPGDLAKLDAVLAQGPLDEESQVYLVRTARLSRVRPSPRAS